MLKDTRRLISGVDENQQSKILEDESVKKIIPYPLFPCFQIQELFYTEENPQSITTRNLAKPYDINLPAGAMRFMKIRMPTITEMIADFKKADQPIPEDWTKFNLHSTDSVDYVHVLSGEITYIAGESLTKLRSGDFLAQIGPEHTWMNDSNEPCYLLCVALGSTPNKDRKKMVVE